MPFRKPSILTPEGESGNWKRVQGRHVFEPTAEKPAEEVGDAEIERWRHPTPAFKKDKFTSVEDNLNVRNIHADGAKESETYIGEPTNQSKLNTAEDKNKVADVKLMDRIKYFLNGEEGHGTVIAMTSGFFTVRKDSGGYQDIQVSDIFFVESIITDNKSWASMQVDERTEVLSKARCPLSFVTRNWDDLPDEVKNVIKSNFESGKYGGIDTSIHFDSSDDYETKEIKDDKENFLLDVKPNDVSSKEPEQVPDSYKHPEITVKDGKMNSPMMAGVKKEEDEEEKKKEGAAMSTGDSGSFNAVSNTRFNSDDKENHIGKNIGVTKSYSTYGLGYGVEKTEDQ